MRRRLPLLLSCIALLVALTGVDPAGAVRAVRRVLFAADAGRVDGLSASRTPHAGELLALGRNARFPASAVPAGPRGPRGPQGPPGPAGTVSNPYVFRAHSLAAQDVNGSTKVILGAKDFDPHGDFDPINSTYVAPVDGYYELSATVAFSGSATGRTLAQLTTNRAGMSIRGTDDAADAFHTAVVAGLMQLRAGDTVELDVHTDQANTIIAAESLTEMSGALVAAGG